MTTRAARSGTLLRLIALVASLLAPGLAAPAESIYSVGNSLTNDMVPDGLVALAADSGTTLEAGFHIRAGSSLADIVATPTDLTYSRGGTWNVALSTRSWNSLTMQPYFGAGSTLDGEAQAILTLIGASRAGTTYFIYAAWPSLLDTGGAYQSYWRQSVSGLPDQRTVLAAEYFSQLQRRVAGSLPATATVQIIPVGEVFARLDDDFRRGTWPGLVDVTALYRDADHMGDVGRFAAAATVYAAVFRRKPQVGASLEIYQQGLGSVPLTPELAQRIEDFVWNVVSKPQPQSSRKNSSGGSGQMTWGWLSMLAIAGALRGHQRRRRNVDC